MVAQATKRETKERGRRGGERKTGERAYVSRRQRRGALMGADAGSDWVSARLTREHTPPAPPPSSPPPPPPHTPELSLSLSLSLFLLSWKTVVPMGEHRE